jgi:hypothetical protein
MMEYLSSYHDPSFRDAHREMFRITPAAIIEWLKGRGMFHMPVPKKQRTLRRWLRKNISAASVAIFGFGLAIGWLLRALWNG